jgi:hypothetical protein
MLMMQLGTRRYLSQILADQKKKKRIKPTRKTLKEKIKVSQYYIEQKDQSATILLMLLKLCQH